MSRTLRALVALLVLAGLGSPLLGACLCPAMARAAEGHDCCARAADTWLQAAYDCCLDDADEARATLSPVKALAPPVLVAASGAADVAPGTLTARPHTIHLTSTPLVLRI